MEKPLLLIATSSYKTTIWDNKMITTVGNDGGNPSTSYFETEKDLDNYFKLQTPSWVSNIMWAVKNRKED